MMRVAVYAMPAPGSTLARLATVWLGRDAFSRRPTRLPDPARDPIVAEPARYGFHATLRAPFRPKPGVTLGILTDRLAVLCDARPAPVIRSLTLARLGTFFALVAHETERALEVLEGDVLDAFEQFRSPLTAAEVARRDPARLGTRQRDLLEAWGYPFVRDEFRFHMTLTGPVSGSADDLRHDIQSHFAPVLGQPLPLDGLGLVVEAEPGAPFYVHSFHAFEHPTAHHLAETT